MGKLSLQDNGVNLYAEHIAAGESVSLIELLYEMRFAFQWSGTPPTYLQMLNALQTLVNQAWADPYNSNSAVVILLFNQGASMTPDPPTLTADTRLNKFQAYIALSGLMMQMYNQGQLAMRSRGFLNMEGGMKVSKSMRTLLFAGALACVGLGAASAGAQSVAGSYSTTWQQLSTLLGSTPTKVNLHIGRQQLHPTACAGDPAPAVLQRSLGDGAGEYGCASEEQFSRPGFAGRDRGRLRRSGEDVAERSPAFA